MNILSFDKYPRKRGHCTFVFDAGILFPISQGSVEVAHLCCFLVSWRLYFFFKVAATFSQWAKIGKKAQFKEIPAVFDFQKLKSTFFKTNSEWSSSEGACGVKRKFQKTLR